MPFQYTSPILPIDIWNVPSFVRSAAGAPSNLVHGVVNRVRYGAWVAPKSFTITRLIWFMGAVSVGNYDIGIYDSTGVALWRKGSTIVPAINVAVEETGMSVPVAKGAIYYLAWWGTDPTVSIRCFGRAFSPMDQDIDGIFWSHLYTAGAAGLDAALPALLGSLTGAAMVAILIRAT